jgi:GxxExxY protein
MNKRTTKGTEGTEGTELRKTLNDLTKSVIGAAIEVHRALGPGLLESAYEICLCRELNLREIQFRRQVPIPVGYKGVKLDCGYRSDVIIEDSLLLELKAVDALLPIHEAQLLSYLKLTGLNVGLLINFNVELLRDGIRRRVLNSGTPLFGSVSSALSVVNSNR